MSSPAAVRLQLHYDVTGSYTSGLCSEVDGYGKIRFIVFFKFIFKPNAIMT